MMYLHLVTYLPGDILTKVDRASMGVGLEVRVPLLGHRVVEFVWKLPMAMKVRDEEGKWLLRQTLAKYLPKELIDRPPIGFSVPIGSSLGGPLRAWAEELPDERRIREDGLLDPAPIKRAWSQHIAGMRDCQHQIWAVLMYQAWKSQWN